MAGRWPGRFIVMALSGCMLVSTRRSVVGALRDTGNRNPEIGAFIAVAPGDERRSAAPGRRRARRFLLNRSWRSLGGVFCTFRLNAPTAENLKKNRDFSDDFRGSAPGY
jgi:hypothetical protein